MFGFDEKKYEQEQIKFQKEEDYRNKRLQQEEFQVCVSKKLEEYLDNEKIKETEEVEETEIVTLTVSKFQVETKGYPHLALYVDTQDEGQVIHVNYLSRRFDIVLKAGLNVLSLLDDMELSVDNVLTLGLVRSKVEFPNTDLLEGTIVDSISGSGNLVHNFAVPCRGFSILNDGTADLTFQIGSVTVPVKAGASFDDKFFIFKQVTITSTSTFKFVGRV
jgi:hypothetical protein